MMQKCFFIGGPFDLQVKLVELTPEICVPVGNLAVMRKYIRRSWVWVRDSKVVHSYVYEGVASEYARIQIDKHYLPSMAQDSSSPFTKEENDGKV